jgi:hypothetical protein
VVNYSGENWNFLWISVFSRPSLSMAVRACNKMDVIFACLVFVGGIHLLHIQLAVGNGRVAIFT